MQIDKWMQEYESQLGIVVMKHPAEYPWFPNTSVQAVALRMRDAFVRGSYSKDGKAIRNTCRAFGIAYTYKAINEFILGGQ